MLLVNELCESIPNVYKAYFLLLHEQNCAVSPHENEHIKNTKEVFFVFFNKTILSTIFSERNENEAVRDRSSVHWIVLV